MLAAQAQTLMVTFDMMSLADDAWPGCGDHSEARLAAGRGWELGEA